MKLATIISALLASLSLLIIPISAQSGSTSKFQIEGMTMAVTQMEPMLSFYSSVFGINFEEKKMFNAKLYQGNWGDLKLLFCPAELAGNTARQNRHQFDIVVPNLKEMMDLALASGGKQMGEISEDDTALSVGIYDPDQNSILFKEHKSPASISKIYKQVDTTTLQMEVYFPEYLDPGSSYPAMVFFFGGGWNGGSTAQFEPHARYFSSRGIVCFLADYRVKNRQQTTPFESLKDARSAIRYIRKNAAAFHIDPDKIIASGGSAGGHLAAATALIDGHNEESDDLSVSCVPDALVLFNPVIDNGPGGYGYERIGDQYPSFSPLHNIREGAPPTIFFLGTQDRLIPVETAKYYQTLMQRVGSRCDLFLFDGEGHGFFNYRSPENYYHTVLETDKFLQELGYLSGEASLKLKVVGE